GTFQYDEYFAAFEKAGIDIGRPPAGNKKKYKKQELLV
ncbi:MAG: hypothetical protein RL725_644, partial [Actinomycetota bacterium]